IIGILAIVLALVGIIFGVAKVATAPTPEAADQVAAFVKDFGGQLQNVSLLAPAADVKAQMEARYGDYVSRELLSAWEADPSKALGRVTSSPWPSGIRVASVRNVGLQSYIVKGFIMEMTSASPKATEGPMVTLGVDKRTGSWEIVEYAVAT